MANERYPVARLTGPITYRIVTYEELGATARGLVIEFVRFGLN